MPPGDGSMNDRETDDHVDMVPLSGSILPQPRGMRDLGPLPTNKLLKIAIHLRATPTLPGEAHDETSPVGVLSLEDFASLFSANRRDMDAVVDYLKSVGIPEEKPGSREQNIRKYPTECMIEADATADQCNRAFAIELRQYDSRRGKYFGHGGEIHVPASLEEIVEDVNGLDNLISLSRVRAEEPAGGVGDDVIVLPDAGEDYAPQGPASAPPAKDEGPSTTLQGQIEKTSQESETEEAPAANEPDTPHLQIPVSLSQVVQGAYEMPSKVTAQFLLEWDRSGLGQSGAPPRRRVDNTPPPTSTRFDTPIQSIVPPEYTLHDPAEVARLYGFPEELDGSGETIAIISLNGFYERSDIDRYFDHQQIPRPEIHVEEIGYRSMPMRSYVDDFELTMDLQVAGSVAPGARLVVYRVAPRTPQPYLTAIKRAILNPQFRPSVVSISYGSAEGLFRPRDLAAADKVFEQATKLGITICAASGDGGSASRDHDAMKPGPHVNFPASSPHVLACGGTAIDVADGRIVREYAWNDHHQCRLATAGGISTIFKRPDYQRDLTLPKNKSDQRGFDGRGVPDVAANACLTTGYRVLFDGKWVPNGGTSAAAPLWAGLVARLNQGLGQRLGFLHPHLYRLAAEGVVRDITEGSNGYYRSAAGWDACTGLGTPKGRELYEALKRELGVQERVVDPEPEPGEEHPDPDPKNADAELQREMAAAIATANRAAMLAQHAANLVSTRGQGPRNYN